ETLLDLLQMRGRRFDPFGVAAEKSGEILELRLDAVARIDIRMKLRIERCQLRDAPPDAPESREERVVAFVKRRVTLRAEPLDAFSAGEHLADRGELDVLGRILQRRAIELAQLECQQVDAGVAVLSGRAHAFELRSERAHRLERGGRGSEQRVEMTERVQHPEMH